MMFHLGSPRHPKGLAPENVTAWNLTHSLIRFCESHGHAACRSELTRCLSAIEGNDRASAEKIARSIPLGGNGCFNDVFIQPIAPHEDDVTAQTCFEALVSCWQAELRPG